MNRKEERKLKILFLKNFITSSLQSFLNTLSEPSLQGNPMIMPLILNQTLSQSFRSPFAWTKSKMKQFKNSYKKISIKVLLDLSIHPKPPPFSFVPKEDGDLRPVQDYHYFNLQTICNGYPLPHIDELIDNLHEYDCYIKMNIRWGYNNVCIKEGDEWKAAFSCREGSFEPLIMFFGLTNSPATFQATMNNIFSQELIQCWLKIYMDNLLICG